jgi:CRISPR/Cas system Type II protein with McrA/HNH and RuvC-like nuclease domain
MPTPRAPRNTATRDEHRRIIAQDEPPCHWCHQPIDYQAHHHDPLAFQVDHVTPVTKGGPDTLDNKVPSHRACNRAKSDKLTYQPGVTFVTERKWWH